MRSVEVVGRTTADVEHGSKVSDEKTRKVKKGSRKRRKIKKKFHVYLDCFFLQKCCY